MILIVASRIRIHKKETKMTEANIHPQFFSDEFYDCLRPVNPAFLLIYSAYHKHLPMWIISIWVQEIGIWAQQINAGAVRRHSR